MLTYPTSVGTASRLDMLDFTKQTIVHIRLRMKDILYSAPTTWGSTAPRGKRHGYVVFPQRSYRHILRR